MVFGTPGPAPTPRLITRDLPSLNVFMMNRAGALTDGAVSTWQWGGGEALAIARGTSGALFVSMPGGPEQAIEIEFVRRHSRRKLASVQMPSLWRAAASPVRRKRAGLPQLPPSCLPLTAHRTPGNVPCRATARAPGRILIASRARGVNAC